MEAGKPYPSDVGDEEWAFVAPYLSYLVRAGAPWRMLPNDLPPWAAVCQQTQRWLAAGSIEAIVHDLRVMLRLAEGRNPEPSAAIFDARTLQSTPESGARAGYDGHKRKKGSKVHMAVDTLGHLLALHVTPANEQERARVEELAKAVQEVTDEHVELAYVDQGYTGEEPAQAAEKPGITLQVVKSCPRPSGASCCCPAAGWWSAASAGWLASDAWPRTTNGWPPPWSGCTSSLSSACSCIALSLSLGRFIAGSSPGLEC